MAAKEKKKIQPRFDWEMLWLFGGIGIGSGGLGILLFWAVYTAPEGGGGNAFALTNAQRLARMLPQDIQSKIAMVMAVLFMLFGAFLLLNAAYRTLRFIVFRK